MISSHKKKVLLKGPLKPTKHLTFLTEGLGNNQQKLDETNA